MNAPAEIPGRDHLSLANGPRPKGDHFLASSRYGSYCIPSEFRRREVPTLLRKGQVYEPETLQFMRRTMGAGDVVTGGAFVGDFFPALHEALAPDAWLHSFEPYPPSFDAAAYTVTLNGLDRVVLHRCAVGAETAELPFVVARNTKQVSLAAGMHILREGEEANANLTTIRVPVLRIDDLVDPRRTVSMLHLDVESHEKAALEGAAKLIARDTPVVLLEGDRGFKVRGYLALLSRLAPEAGYTFVGAIESNAIFRPLGTS